MLNYNEENKEGYVIRFLNGERYYIKFENYEKIFNLVNNVSNIIVWEHMKNNFDFNIFFDRVPDEFTVWLKKNIDQLQLSYNEIERQALKEFIRIYHINNIKDRKDFANYAIKSYFRSILFRLFDKKQYNFIIWNIIKPTIEKPFHKKN